MCVVLVDIIEPRKRLYWLIFLILSRYNKQQCISLEYFVMDQRKSASSVILKWGGKNVKMFYK